MLQVGDYVFKQAETREEFEQVHSLNYRTFVSEIPQHDDPGNGRLVDKFHDKNIYFIAVHQGRVVGMISAHDRPPFSVASRMPDPDILTRPGVRPLEVRLLAVEPERRNGTVFTGLSWLLHEHACAKGHTHLFISGVENRIELYRHIGFEPLGPAVSSGGARFVPMAMTVEQLCQRHSRTALRWKRYRKPEADVPTGGELEPALSSSPGPRTVCLLPGPVTIAPQVQEAFHQPAIYHRGAEFITLFEQVRRSLVRLVNGRDVALLNGSGTLANEVIAATLAAERGAGRGVLLVNGEFGERLVRQASRFGLTPYVLRWPWGQAWNLEEVETALGNQPRGTWVWGVHQESSTGVLNDLPGLVHVAKKRAARVCADCISSLGAVPLDLQDVYLASGATGKSLGAFAGAAIVFTDRAALGHLDTERVPSYLDLAAALATRGPQFTFPSPTLRALATALEAYAAPPRARERYQHYAALGEYVRQQLHDLGLELLAAEPHACPVVTTFAPPGGESSEAFVARCRLWGYAIGGQSGYLAERRLVQIATMGAVTLDDIAPLFGRFAEWNRRSAALTPA